MKLTVFVDQDGNQEYRTSDGSVIPNDTVALWQDISDRTEQRIKELEVLLAELQAMRQGRHK